MMASEDLKTQVPVEENGTKEEEKNGNLASASNENGDSSYVSSVIQKEDEEGEGEAKGDCFGCWVVLKLLNLSFLVVFCYQIVLKFCNLSYIWAFVGDLVGVNHFVSSI